MKQRLSTAILFVCTALVSTSPVGSAQGDPNQQIFMDYYRRAVEALPTGELPVFGEHQQLVLDLYYGVHLIPGLSPPTQWCAAEYTAYLPCDGIVGAQPSVFNTGTNPHLSCKFPPTENYELVASQAQGLVVPGSVVSYIVFYHATFGAPSYAFRVSDIGHSGFVSTVCSSGVNSTGAPATMWASSPTSVPLNDFSLTVTNAPPGRLGVFFYGSLSAPVPFGDGTLCVGGSPGVFRLNPPGLIDGNGSLSRTIDFDAHPAAAGPGKISPGSAWYFQFWYRDPVPGGAGFNLSDTIKVRFCN